MQRLKIVVLYHFCYITVVAGVGVGFCRETEAQDFRKRFMGVGVFESPSFGLVGRRGVLVGAHMRRRRVARFCCVIK